MRPILALGIAAALGAVALGAQQISLQPPSIQSGGTALAVYPLGDPTPMLVASWIDDANWGPGIGSGVPGVEQEILNTGQLGPPEDTRMVLTVHNLGDGPVTLHRGNTGAMTTSPIGATVGPGQTVAMVVGLDANQQVTWKQNGGTQGRIAWVGRGMDLPPKP